MFSRQLSPRNGMHVNLSLHRTLHNTSRCRQKVDAGLRVSQRLQFQRQPGSTKIVLVCCRSLNPDVTTSKSMRHHQRPSWARQPCLQIDAYGYKQFNPRFDLSRSNDTSEERRQHCLSCREPKALRIIYVRDRQDSEGLRLYTYEKSLSCTSRFPSVSQVFLRMSLLNNVIMFVPYLHAHDPPYRLRNIRLTTQITSI